MVEKSGARVIQWLFAWKRYSRFPSVGSLARQTIIKSIGKTGAAMEAFQWAIPTNLVIDSIYKIRIVAWWIQHLPTRVMQYFHF